MPRVLCTLGNTAILSKVWEFVVQGSGDRPQARRLDKADMTRTHDGKISQLISHNSLEESTKI
ncbi:MAG TPA: hypothetical protein V6C84_01925 [Coleofasciculaceae cyanobacterium]